MIPSIGFIPNNREIKNLNHFIPDEYVKSKLDYLQIPCIPKSDEKDENITDEIQNEDFPEIKSTDKIVFAASNSEHISNVAFYGYDDKEVFFHHDLFVFSTILDSCYFTNTSVAVATFESDIFIYDFMIDLPVLPQALLTGHTAPVTVIKNKNGRILSGSEDKKIIEWDFERLVSKNMLDCGVEIESFDFEDSNIAFGANTYLNINNENISLNSELEKLKIKGNLVFIGDSNGFMTIFDLRNLSKPILYEKIHDGGITDICLANDWIVTSSFNNEIKLFKYENDKLDCRNTIEKDTTVYSLGFDENAGFNDVFCGDEDDQVFAIKLE